MRVLLVSHHFPPDSAGGVERYTQALARELVRRGDVVSIVTRRDSPPGEIRLLRERLPDGTAVYRLAGGSFDFEGFLNHHAVLERLFTVAMLEAAPEVVHINHLLKLSPRFIEIIHRLGAPVVLSLHDFYFACPLVHLQKLSGELCPGPDAGQECARSCFHLEGARGVLRWGLRSMYFRRLLRMVERLVCYSHYVALYFSSFGADPDRLHVVPNGILPDLAEPADAAWPTPRQRGVLKLAFLGTVVGHKGAHVILEALRLAKLPSVDLVMIGQIPEPEYMRQLRDSAATIPRLKLRLYGVYERTQLSYLLQDIDCVIVPSLVPEAGPIVPREVLARGIPVAASRLGALPEIVSEGQNGFLFDPTRPGELSAILQQLVSNDELVISLREGARRTPVVSVTQHAETLRSVYQQALQDWMRRGGPREADVSELQSLHNALLHLGFDHANESNDEYQRLVP